MSSKPNSRASVTSAATPRGCRARALAVAIPAALALAAPASVLAQQQDEPAPADVQTLDAMVVTGSHIRGTPEDAALPVEVYTAEDLRMQGSPTVLDFVKSLSITASVLGESNQTNTNLGAQTRSGGGTIGRHARAERQRQLRPRLRPGRVHLPRRAGVAGLRRAGEAEA